jgi:hypothetical protein
MIALPGFDLRLIDFKLIIADIKIARPAEITGEAGAGSGWLPLLREYRRDATELSCKDQRERSRARQASTHPSLRAQAPPAGLVTNLRCRRHPRGAPSPVVIAGLVPAISLRMARRFN